MTDVDPQLPYHRRSMRLRDYDYSQAGGYFVTICTHGGIPNFGIVRDGEMHLNDFGRIVEEEWLRTSIMRRNVVLDQHNVMPNHVHGILLFLDDISDGGVFHRPPPQLGNDVAAELAPCKLRSPGSTLGAIIRGFKGATTRRINAIRKTEGVAVWQRSYYEHVIRNDSDMQRIREYIMYNSVSWAEDRFHRT